MKIIETVHASEEVQTVETAAEGGVLASLGINGTLFAAQLFNFTLVATILWFLILKPLSKKLTDRQKMIDDSIKNSKKIEENLAKSEEKFQEKINQAKVESNKIVERAGEEAGKAAEAVKTKAKQEIETLIDQAKKNIRHEREEMKMEIKKETAAMIVLALEKILSEKITDKKDKELIDEMVKKIQ
ncbi:MAG: ATP synthase F0 subunit B [Candidatus Magasanikbacteria bacterium RIFCSPLOWO2_02_FULL_44_11]|uniref:ATP synthase subunit b n=1 Tax=Candidatus Magasanikbacteria bacterium RIFCSPLOWO2_02_FULL_44_11 TaxID=1798689 RepID=A0A1F6N911_9BACT|nr:MAG: ATP synthase F0 subunit B [Candidatus Magasanikbacteria bacterium RIFCSPLOWO2_02_FULL_44_11]